MTEALMNSSRSGRDAPRVFARGTGGACVVGALAARNIPYRYLPADEITNPKHTRKLVAEFCINGATYYMCGGCVLVADPHGALVPGGAIDGPTAQAAGSKDLGKTFLRKHGISVPEGTVFFRGALREAETYFAELLRSKAHGICLKPNRGKLGRGVHVGIRDKQSFCGAFAAIGRRAERIVVEETVLGPVYRFNCLGGRVITIEYGRPANVEGDGIHTIEELVELKNLERRLNPGHAGTLLRLGKRERSFLSRAGLGPDHVPEAGQQVLLSDVSNVHQGGECIVVTDAVHQSYIEVVERVLSLVPDFVICGADVAIPNAALPATGNNYHILELNRCPGLNTSHYPWRGQPRDLAGAIIDYLATAAPIAGTPGSPKPFSKGSSGDCVVEALTARGIAYHYLSPEEITNPLLTGKTILAFEVEDVPYYFDGGSLRVSDPRGVRVPGSLIDGQTAVFVKRKDLVKSFLRRHGVSVPRGAAFPRDAEHEAESYFTTLCRSRSGGVCVKPIRGKKGQQVHVGLRDLASFRAAFAAVGETHEQVLIEETVSGEVYRFTCLGGRVIAIECGRPANVEGDGTHTIAELVELKNLERRLNPGHAGTLLRLREREHSFLSRAGLGPDHVPEAGQQVLLSDVSNMHQGGEFIDATDAVHRSYIDVIERAVKLVPDLVLCGADVVIENASAPAAKHNYHVLELNCGPGFSTNHFPWRGQPRDVAGAIVDFLMNRRR